MQPAEQLRAQLRPGADQPPIHGIPWNTAPVQQPQHGSAPKTEAPALTVPHRDAALQLPAQPAGDMKPSVPAAPAAGAQSSASAAVQPAAKPQAAQRPALAAASRHSRLTAPLAVQLPDKLSIAQRSSVSSEVQALIERLKGINKPDSGLAPRRKGNLPSAVGVADLQHVVARQDMHVSVARDQQPGQARQAMHPSQQAASRSNTASAACSRTSAQPSTPHAAIGPSGLGAVPFSAADVTSAADDGEAVQAGKQPAACSTERVQPGTTLPVRQLSFPDRSVATPPALAEAEQSHAAARPEAQNQFWQSGTMQSLSQLASGSKAASSSADAVAARQVKLANDILSLDRGEMSSEVSDTGPADQHHEMTPEEQLTELHEQHGCCLGETLHVASFQEDSWSRLSSTGKSAGPKTQLSSSSGGSSAGSAASSCSSPFTPVQQTLQQRKSTASRGDEAPLFAGICAILDARLQPDEADRCASTTLKRSAATAA